MVSRVSTAEFSAGKRLAPRPTHSVLSLDKLESTGYRTPDAASGLASYLSSLGVVPT
jgi:dTDP-4-dehydrorhamnose 3,5-epimerase